MKKKPVKKPVVKKKLKTPPNKPVKIANVLFVGKSTT